MSPDRMDIASSQMDDEIRDAVESGKLERTVELLDQGANLHVKGADGDSLLHIAATDGRTELCKLLLDKGIPLEIRSDDGWTALMNAAYWGYQETFDFLLGQGAELQATNKKGQTAYGLSFNNMPPVMALHLAKLGGSMTADDLQNVKAGPYAGLTAIEVAARGGLQAELLEMLRAPEPWPINHGIQGLRDLAEKAASPECVAIIDAHRASEVIRQITRRRSHQP